LVSDRGGVLDQAAALEVWQLWLQRASIAAIGPGTLARIELQSGAHATAGQPLVRLDDRTERAELAAL
jgi:multidrug resistance efflux pump